MDSGTSPAMAVPAPTAPSSVAANVAALAKANIGKGAGTCSQVNSSLNSLGGSAFYTSCTGNGGSAEYWCADFAMWVWSNAGIDITGLTPGAGSFIADASQNGSTVHTSSTYVPQVGDAVVYDYNGAGVADHVGLVTGVNSDGSITTANGDFGGESGTEAHFSETSTVLAETISAAQKQVGDVPSTIGMTISAYVTPSGLS
jgi:cell wall-associated NlpC family hydrolase